VSYAMDTTVDVYVVVYDAIRIYEDEEKEKWK
jgi:hypothetical protein